MRIVCWNVEGEGPPEQNTPGRRDQPGRPGLLNYLVKWKADVAIFLEPPDWMRKKGEKESTLFERKEGEKGPTESRWRLKGYKQGHHQGFVFVAYKDGDINVEIKGGVSVPGAFQDNHLVFLQAEKGDKTLRIATCHAPYANNSGEAAQYCISAMKNVLLKNQSFGVAGSTDIWMGDLNTYRPETQGSRKSARAQQAPYVLALAEPTSGFGKKATGSGEHSPLDKIFVKAGLRPSARGRIIPKDLPGPKASEARDIKEPDWTDDRKVPADHIPIYIDTSPIDTSPMEAVPQPIASTSSDSSERKHPRDPMPADPPDTRRKKRKVEVSDEPGG